MSQTVQRAIDILSALGDRPRNGNEIATILGVSKSTASRLLQTLEENRFARRDEHGKWVLGNQMIGIAEKALRALDLRSTASPHMRRLEKITGHTVHLAELLGDEVIYIDKVDGRDAVQMYSRVGKRVQIHAAGIGKAILAHLEQPLKDSIISTLTFERYSSYTITDEAQLRDELLATERRGWARDNGEFEELINCIAAPVRRADGTVRAAISITTLKVIASLDELESKVQHLLAAAAAISHDSGWK